MKRFGIRNLAHTASYMVIAGVCLFSAIGTHTAAAMGSGGGDFVKQFAQPDTAKRPKIRWWLPADKMSDEEIRREIASMAQAGIGGVEIATASVEGGDAAGHGWGSPEWNKRIRTALAAAKKYGLTVDITVGPQYPAAVPSITKEDPAAAKELVYGKAAISGGTTYNGAVPAFIEVPLDGLFGAPARQPGTPSLLAVTAAKVAEGSSSAATPVVLEPGSLVDITQFVMNGQLTWTAPAGEEWVIFSFWQRSTGQLVTGAPTPSYAVDHFSSAGTKAVTDYWEKQLLTPEVRSLLKQNGGGLYEDSLELLSSLHWTPQMINEFKKSRGYDITPYLPVLFIPRLHDFMGILAGTTVDSAPAFALADGNDSRVRNDYYHMLTSLYAQHHLGGLEKWGNKQGLQLRAQPAYGMTTDMATASTFVDVPEIEQFYFRDTLDSYRVMAGAAHLSDKPVISGEIAPVLTSMLMDGYGSSWKRMLEISNQNLAGGVNQVVWHGFPYADVANTTWPGWHPFGSSALPGFAEAWGPRQPTWQHMPDINNYVSRQQVVLQTGKPRVDVAIYRQSYWDSPVATVLYDDQGLQRAGYTYDFVGPSLLDGASARVDKGRLATEGPAYRAIVLNNQDALPLDAAKKILSFAKQGLPVIVVGNTPAHTPFFNKAAQQDVELQQIMAQLLAQPRVVHIANETELTTALAGKQIRPAARYHTPSGLLNVHRATKDADYYYFFNNSAETVDHHVSLEGTGDVYTLDAWTGSIAPASASSTLGSKTVRVTLKAHDTAIIAITPDKHFANTPQKNVAMGTSQQLSLWNLSVEDWQPGATSSETTKSTHQLGLNQLKPWTEISGLEDVSGIGRYTTDIYWDAKRNTGAYLNLGAFFDTAQVFVNGRQAAPVNINDPQVDVSKHLKKGKNTITVEVATTLRNRLRTINAGQAIMPRQEYGLIGPVRLVPYTY